MTTPRNRFTVAPFIVALFAAFVALPALAVVKVNQLGMGIEHEQPWRRVSNGLSSAASVVRHAVARLGEMLEAMQRHALFRPAVGAAALLIATHQSNALLAMPVLMGVLTEGQHAGEFVMEERGGAGQASRENITVLSGQTLTAGAVIGRVKLGIGRISIPTVSGTGNGTVGTVFAGPEVEVGSYVATCTAAAANAGTFSVTTPRGKALPAATVAVAYTSRHISFTIADGSTDYIVGDSFTFVVSTTAPTVIGGTGTGVMTALSLGPDAKTGRYQVINRAVVTNGGDFEVIGPDGASVGRFLMGTGSTGTASFTSRTVNFTLSDATDYILGNYFDICVYNELSGGKVVAWDPTTFDGRHRAEGGLYDNVNAASGDLAGVIVTRDAVFLKGSLQWGTAITAAQKESAYLDLAKRGIVCR